ncbi:aminoacyl-tRNA hydrolase [Selenihalanaerobacter shriftii]|uniref:Peptidyl-tRNA hydrolase n=1 Tax=Selenihalanaerobacter shriftii TaxID=142842 RepID=A0A1T4N5A0_9FIRM|nr:aminoacyl-tRNA hydrolase [Selenihalanaerobacter shriftii]SJZ74276.1 peptidyl-tRNA hydrolase, PTH1 family [Selenihalanaerobacter shriftii]
MKLIVGLGNPDFKYSKTRHNIGFRIIDEFANQYQIKVNKEEKKALIGKSYLQGEKVILAKPQTYMNNSGQAVGELIRWYDIELEDVLIIYDDLDLELGQLRVRPSGGHGGHNGMKSIFNHLNNKSIPRIRVGIGRPPEYMTVTDYVLGKFSKENRNKVKKITSKAVDAIYEFLVNDINSVMNNFN